MAKDKQEGPRDDRTSEEGDLIRERQGGNLGPDRSDDAGIDADEDDDVDEVDEELEDEE